MIGKGNLVFLTPPLPEFSLWQEETIPFEDAGTSRMQRLGDAAGER